MVRIARSALSIAIFLVCATPAVASHLKLTGTFEPLDGGDPNGSDVWIEALSVDFSATISWPEQAASYSDDQSPEDDNLGVYLTTQGELSITVGGNPLFTQPPDQLVWSSHDSTALPSLIDETEYFGDELRLFGIGIRAVQLTVGEGPMPSHPSYVNPPSTYDIESEVSIALRAIDFDGDVLGGDSLVTSFDPPLFDDIWFEMSQSFKFLGLPGSCAWRGRIHSIVAVPEPNAAAVMATLCMLAGGLRARRLDYL